MTADPKPPVRAPKARKPIARKRATPRRVRNRCADPDHPRCKRIAIHIGRCGTHADEYLLKLRRERVVKSFCELSEWHNSALGMRCGGAPQDNHGIERGYTRGNLRWTGPGFSGCAAINTWAHYHPLEWREFLRDEWGREEYERLVELALHGPKADYDQALADLSAEKEGD
jgi:hypothetical protein